MSEKPEKTPLYRRKPRGCGGIFFTLAVVAAAIWGGLLGGFVWVLENTRDTIAMVEVYRPKIGTRVYSADGVLLGELTKEYRQLVSLNEMPLHLQKAFIASEDEIFYEHKGVRPDAIVNAALFIARTGNLRGGSTITQQIVRNVDVTGVSTEQTLRRKLNEALIALQLERKYTKDEILELYLNQIFLGISASGVEAASQQFFAKSCRDINLSQSALLAGLAPSPNRYQPFKHPDRALEARNRVLDRMLESGFITKKEYDEAKALSIDDIVVTPEERAEMVAQGQADMRPNVFKAAYFAEEVRQALQRDIALSTEEIFENGLSVYTTLDWRLQQAAEEALLKGLDEFDKSRMEYLKARGRESEFIPVSGGLVCISNRPETRGHVVAMVGGRDFEKEKYNTVTQARRQPGSSIKPFVWLAALANGYTASSIVVDEPYTRYDAVGTRWSPKNFDGKYLGPITLRTAIEKSVNIVSVKLVEDLGMPVVRWYFENCQPPRYRIPVDDMVNLTIALGTPVTTVIGQCVSFSVFANGGVRHDPIMITEIKNRDGFTIYKPTPTSERVIPEDLAYLITYLLEGAATWGTGARSSALGRPRAGKTGTTNDARDVWFCGYTPDYTCVVWVGYRDNRPLGSGINFTGGRLACPIWTEFMLKAHEGLPKKDFTIPPGVTFYAVDRSTGLRGGNFREAFIGGAQPPTEWPVFDIAAEEAADELATLEFHAF